MELLFGHRSNINPRIIVDSDTDGRDDLVIFFLQGGLHLFFTLLTLNVMTLANFVTVADGKGNETTVHEGVGVNLR